MDGGAWWAAVHGVAESWTRLSDFTFTLWRRKWQPTPGFLPRESHGRRGLVGCGLWGYKELDPTNLESTFKSRDITLPTKVRLVKAMVFLVVMYGCESWL